jgi:GNAT superfamily N-acetyltransferase
LTDDIKLHYNDLNIQDYNTLRKAVGWQPINDAQAERGIKNSFYIVTAKKNEITVGMARVVSDGGYVAIIVDVIVMPEYQGLGIGKAIMQNVMDFLHCSIQDGERLHINLMAAHGKEEFYKKFGFDTRPNENVGAGMTQFFIK